MRAIFHQSFVIYWFGAILFSCGLNAQPQMPNALPSSVYRIVQFNPEKTLQGTAVMLRDSIKGCFLVTNAHMTFNSKGKLSDSLWVFLNSHSGTNEVISGPRKVCLRLKVDQSSQVYLSEDKQMDIVIVDCTEGNGFILDPTIPDSVFWINANTVNKSEIVNVLLDSTSIYTAIGYPSKGINQQSAMYPEFRWGRYSGTNQGFQVFDIPVIGGSSGSAVFYELGNKYAIVGIIARGTDKLCFAIPIGSLVERFASFFQR